MIVDDSMVARAVLSRMVEADGAFEIAAVAGTAEDAIDALQFVQVDVILLDLEMPGAGGLQTLPRIIEAARGARVMIVSSLAEDGAEETIAALAMGAADTLPKPGTGRFNGRFSEILVGRLRALGHVEHKGPRIPEPLRQRFESPLRAMSPDPVQLLAIGASTGGIHALGCLFQALPPRIHIPILVTQHLPAAFMTVFARQLGVAAKREAVIAEDGMALLPDRILIAPGDAHLKVELANKQLVARLDRKRSASGCLPSVDPMFASAAAALGSAVMGVVLTGMGRDGVEGATQLVASGGSVLAQDEASCAVYGMPRAVAEAGLVCAVMPPDKLARRIAARAGERSWR
jgi:two-component system chemotaxis response regulator CheB